MRNHNKEQHHSFSQNKRLVFSNRNTIEKEFWLKKLSGKPCFNGFPFDSREPVGTDPVPGSCKFALTPAVFSLLMDQSDGSDYKLHIILMAGIMMLLHQYTGSNDIMIVTPIYKPKTRKEHINTLLPINLVIKDSMTFRHFLQETAEALRQAVAYGNYPVDLIPRKLNLEPAGSHSFFDVAVVVENIHHKHHLLPVKPGVSFSFQRRPSGMDVILEYDTALYKKSFVCEVIENLQGLMQKALQELDEPVSSMRVATAREPRLEPGDQGTVPAYLPPRDEIESKLVEIWGEVLEIDSSTIGIDDVFFALDGQSLKAIMMTSKIHKVFHLSIPLPVIFKLPTVRGLADHIKKTTREGKEESNRYASIQPVEKKEYYPLSSAQKRLYILNRLDPDSTVYNVPQVLPLKEGTDRKRLEEVFRQLIRRHESFRTSFKMVNGQPVQVVHEQVTFSIDYHQRSPLQENETAIPNDLRPFDLSRAPLLRVGLIEVKESHCILVVDIHHIISDAATRKILSNEFAALLEGKKLPPLRLQYKDYSEWCQLPRQQQAVERQEKYWLKQLYGEIPVLNLPIDYPRPLMQSFAGNAVDFILTGSETQMIKNKAGEIEATLYMFILSIFTILISKLSAQEDIIVGTPVAARRHEDLNHIAGIFINTLALRNYPRGDKKIIEFLKELNQRTLEAFENQEYQFEDLVEKVSINRDTSRNPLFDTMFMLQNMEAKANKIPLAELSQLKNRPSETEQHTAKFDLTLNCFEMRGELLCSFEYCTKLFKRQTIERFTMYFQKILWAVLENPEQKISRIEIITAQEKDRILHEFNNTEAAYEKDKTICELFEAQVERTPGKIAIVGPAKSTEKHNAITYGQLNKKANQLAHYLREKGVKADCIVAIMIERSLEMMIGIFSILKSGGAYLPIEANYPGERINYILRDSHAGVLLSRDRFLIKVEVDCEVIDPGSDEFRRHEISNLGKVNTAKNMSYVIYTSGSTGKPKGVAIEHRSVINRLNWMQKAYPIANEDVILQKTPVVFDVSVWELFWWSFQGSSLYLLGPGEEKNPEAIIAAIDDFHISVMHFVPSMLHSFLTYLEANPGTCKAKSLKHLFSSGEALLPQHVTLFNRLFAGNKKTRLINLYGPTEATVDVSYYNCLKEGEIHKIPIGKPIDNIKLLVVSANLHLQPPGIAGELCISGAGTARGYLNNIELTHKKFIANPFPVGGHSLYRTGDSCRWLADGNIEFLGRIDRQVKIRGFRIELGEIECMLLKHTRVKETVVVTRGAANESSTSANNDKYVCAYIVPGEGQTLSITGLTEYLSTGLPDYMIPAYFVFLERMPFTINGKIDYNALPAPDTGDDSAVPQTETQKKLAAIWADVLGIEMSKIGIDANFFKMGGHSLKAIMLTTRIHKEFNTKIPLVDIFKHPTIGKLAIYLKESTESPFASIPAVEKKEFYPLSSAQKRLYILQQMNVSRTAYNIPFQAPLIGKFDKRRFREAFMQLIKRHENFRTSFEVINGEYVQRIHDNIEFELHYYRCNHDEAREKIGNFVRAFHLSRPPLFRVGIIETGENRRLLLVDMHHIISDGLSYDVFKRDLTALYEGDPLPEMKLQYKDFSEWQNHLIKSGQMEKQEKYWLDRFKGEIPILDLPTDYARPPVHRFEGDVVTAEIAGQLTGKVKKLALESKVTLYILLLAVYSILLSKYTARADIIIGSDNAGRMHPELDGIIGFFANMLPLRNFPEDHKIFADYLEEVRENALLAFDNQEYQFEELVSQLQLEREAGRHPLVDTVFSIQNLNDGEITVEGGIPAKDMRNEVEEYGIAPNSLENKVAHFDLLVIIHDVGDTINITWEYATTLFKRSTIEKISKRYLEILKQVIENRHIALKDIEITHDFVGVNLNRFQQEFDNWDFQ